MRKTVFFAALVVLCIYDGSYAASEVFLPGDVMVAGKTADKPDFQVFSLRLKPRRIIDLSDKAVIDFEVSADTASIYAISQNAGGTIYQFDREFNVIFDGPNRTWGGCDFRQIKMWNGYIYFLSGLKNGQLLRGTAGFTELKWGADNLNAIKMAVSPSGKVFVASKNSGGTIYRFDNGIDAAHMTDGAKLGLIDLDIVDIAADDDQLIVASNKDGGTLLFFDLDLKPRHQTAGGLAPLGIAIGEKAIFVASAMEGGRALRLNADGGIQSKSMPIEGICAIAWQPFDGTVVVCAGGADGRIMKLSGDLKTVISRQSVGALAAGLVKPVLFAPFPERLVPAKGWQNSLKPTGKSAGRFELVKTGKAAAEVVLPSAPTPQEEKAAIELVYWIKAASGVQLPIRFDDQDAPKGRAMISIGKTQYAKQADVLAGASDMGSEGYMIAMKEGNLYIDGGSQRGPIYGVMAFLEEDLGFRWYDRFSFSGPQGDSLVAQPVDRVCKPALERRDPHYSDAFDVNWSIRNRTNGVRPEIPQAWGGYIRAVPSFVHTYALLLPESYFEQHPEWFSLLYGQRIPRQLCPMHPQVREEVIKRVKELLKNDPSARCVDVSQNDYPDYCTCDLCKAVIEQEGSATGPNLSLVNAVAEAIEKEYPDVFVTTLAYLSTAQPPKTMRPRPNVRIWYATDQHWTTICRPVTDNPKIVDQIAAWNKIGAKLHIWHYPIDYHRYVRPVLNMPAMTEDLRYFVRNGATGFMFQGNHSNSIGVDRAILRCWVWSKQLWDPQRDTQALIKDFNYGYYGKAAEPIQRYNEWLWDMSVKLQKTEYFQEGEKDHIPVYTQEFVRKGREFLDEALKLAADDEALAKRVRLARLPVLFVQAELGAGADVAAYLTVVDEIERIVKENGICFLKRGLANYYDESYRMIRLWRNLALIDKSAISFEQIPAAGWKIKADPNMVGTKEGWHTADYRDEDWLDIEIGTFWDNTKFGFYEGFAWYRTKLRVDETLLNRKHLYLLFGAADEYAKVYLDGQEIIDHTYGATLLPPEISWQTPFAVDIKQHVVAGKSHCLAINVQNRIAAGGLWKPVWLVSTDQELPADTMLDFIVKSQGGY